jgi:hypothetical protein
LIFSVLAGVTAPFISIVMGDAISILNPLKSDAEIHDGIILLLKEIAIISSLLWFFSYI